MKPLTGTFNDLAWVIRLPADPENPKGQQGKTEIAITKRGMTFCTLYIQITFAENGMVGPEFFREFGNRLNSYGITLITAGCMGRQIAGQLYQRNQVHPNHFSSPMERSKI